MWTIGWCGTSSRRGCPSCTVRLKLCWPTEAWFAPWQVVHLTSQQGEPGGAQQPGLVGSAKAHQGAAHEIAVARAVGGSTQRSICPQLFGTILVPTEGRYGVRSGPTEGRWKQAESLLQLGQGLVRAVALLGLNRHCFHGLVSVSFTPGYLVLALSAVVLAIVLGLCFKWVLAIHGELRMLKEHLAEYIEPIDGSAAVFAVMFSILLGLLGWLTDEPVAFSLVLAVYSAGDIWGQTLRDRQLKTAFQAAASKDPEGQLAAGRAAVESYYLGKPHIPRSATVMFFSFAASTLAFQGETATSAEAQLWWRAAAYAVIALNLVGNEVVLWRWRRERDAVLGDRYSY
jgi:hypothetical protein